MGAAAEEAAADFCRADRRAVAEVDAEAVQADEEADVVEVRAGAAEAALAVAVVGAAAAAGVAAGRAAVADRDHRRNQKPNRCAVPTSFPEFGHQNEVQIQDTIRMFRIVSFDKVLCCQCWQIGRHRPH